MATARPSDSAPSQKDSEVEVEIKLVAVPTSIIASLALPDANPDIQNDISKKESSFLGKKYKQLKTYQKGGNTQFVRMPKHEYEMYWARDAKGKYVGSEPEGCEEGLRILKVRLGDENMQGVGKKNVQEEIVRDWKPLEERTGWTHTAVSGVPSVT